MNMVGLRILSVIAALFIHSTGISQVDDYKLIRSDYLIFESSNIVSIGGTCYGCGNENLLFGIRVDSTTKSEDEIICYFNNEIVQLDYSKFIIGPSVFGDSIIEQTDGISRCFSLDSVEIVINRFLKQGESYVMYTYEDGHYISSTVASHQSESFLDVSDSVKTFSLQLYDNKNNPIDDPVNNLVFKLSKSYGLIECFSLRDFPEPYFRNNYNGDLNLKLISNSLVNSDDLFITWGDIYDFDIGDEYHYQNENYLFGNPNDNGIENVVKHISNKVQGQTTDTITYTIEERRWGDKIHLTPDSAVVEHYKEESTYDIVYTNLNELLLIPEIMPMEAILKDESLTNIVMYKNQDLYNGRFIILIDGQQGFSNEGDYWFHAGYSYSGEYTNYILGCGELYTSFLSDAGTTELLPSEHLVYYKKDDETWGEPLSNRLYETENQGINIFPNPSNSIATISAAEEIDQVLVYSIVGKLILTISEIKSHQQVLDVSTFDKGIYLMIMRTSSGESFSEKLIVE